MILPNEEIQQHGSQVPYLILKAVFAMGTVYSMIDFLVLF